MYSLVTCTHGLSWGTPSMEKDTEISGLYDAMKDRSLGNPSYSLWPPWYTFDKAAQLGALRFSLTSYCHIQNKPNTLEHKQDVQLPSLHIILVITAVFVYSATFSFWWSYWTQKSHRIHGYENGIEARVML